MVQIFQSIFIQAWILTAEMAPYLLLGFLVAGFLHIFVPVSWVVKHLGGNSVKAVFKASLLGIPLPLCSCGVLPVAVSLRKAGSGTAPSLSFLITTPVTGVDSLMATWALMGGVFTILRLVVSLIIGLFTGLVMVIINQISPTDNLPDNQEVISANFQTNSSAATFGQKIKQVFLYGLVELPASIAGSILIGLLLGGVIAALLPPDLVGKYLGAGFWGLVVSVIVAIPLYVCATGSIPIAMAMMVSGFSPGAALAFLIAGPATNTVAITTVKSILGVKALWVYLLLIFAGALGFGTMADIILPADLIISLNAHSPHWQELSVLKILSGLVLLALLFYFIIKEKLIARIFAPKEKSCCCQSGKSCHSDQPHSDKPAEME